MDYWGDAPFRRVVFAGITLYLLLGTCGVLLISDDFDQERYLFYQNVGFPLCLLFYCTWFFFHDVVTQKRQVIYSLIAANILAFAWGNWVFFDYLMGQDNAQQLTGQRGTAYTKGISGGFYKTRW